MRSCATRTLHVSRATAILGYAAQVSVRAGSVIAHLASLNRNGPNRTFRPGFDAALRLPETGHSNIVQPSRLVKVSCAGRFQRINATL